MPNWTVARKVLAMVEQRQAQRRGRVLGGIRPTGEDHRATTFELFFDLVYVFAAEHRLLEAHGQARVKLALEAYTFAHFPIVAGIVVAALGVEGVMAHADEAKPLGDFYAPALFGGVALYLAGQPPQRLALLWNCP